MNTFQSEPSHSEEQQHLSRKERRMARRHEARASVGRQSLMRKFRRVLTWLAVLAVLVLAGWGMWYLAQQSPSVTGLVGTLSVDVAPGEHARGNPDAAITVVEYSDFQCPACASFEPVLQDLFETSGDQVRLIYRHFPLRNIHPNADPAARAAEAAALQDKFWEMHDLIFERQAAWAGQSVKGAEGTFTEYAVEIGLDVERYADDVNSDAVKDAVNEDVTSGTQSQVNSTPSFFVNGQYISGFSSLEDFRTRVLSAPPIQQPPSEDLVPAESHGAAM